MHTVPEASKVVLTPVDTNQLPSGYRVTPGTTFAEKKQLSKLILQQGESVTIKYGLDGTKAAVVYEVSQLEPPTAYVGRRTRVVIEGEAPAINGNPALRGLRRNSLSRLSLGLGLGSLLDLGLQLKRGPTSQQGQGYSFDVQPYKRRQKDSDSSLMAMIRASMQEKLSWLNEQLELCKASNLEAPKLSKELASLEEALKEYW